MCSQELSIMVANPSGNVTIFVLSPVPRSQYAFIANKLLSMTELHGEQVSFIRSMGMSNQSPIAMDMSGLEFCGNASRAFALFVAREHGITEKQQIMVSVSGCPLPLPVTVDVQANRSSIAMPKPLSVKKIQHSNLSFLNNSYLIRFSGISHVILKDIPPTEDSFTRTKNALISENDSAFGVMFYDTQACLMTPVVFVKDISSTYFEGSCASGSAALCIALSHGLSDGIQSYTVKQPSGELLVTIEKQGGSIKEILLDGDVEFESVRTVSIK